MSYRLKDIRIDHDLTQKYMAQKFNVSRSTYSGWENEGDNIPLYQFNNFCEIFNLSLDYVAKIIDRREEITNNIKKKIDYKLIGQRLEIVRKENKITQKQLSKIMGISEATYVNYKNGKTPIQTEILKEFALYFKVSLDWLVGKSEIKKLKEEKI